MTVYIDKHGGYHYHKKGCLMTLEPQYHYEPVEKRLRPYHPMPFITFYKDIRVDGQTYHMCPACFGGRRK